MTEVWRKVWRDGIAPYLSSEELEALSTGLASNHDRIITRSIMRPMPEPENDSQRVTHCDPVIYGAWRRGVFATVGEAIAYYDRVSLESDMSLGCPATIGMFLNWWDHTPREVAVKMLYDEVSYSIAEKRGALAT